MKRLTIPQVKQNVQYQKVFRLMILEDNELYNDVLTHQLEYYTAVLAIEKNCRFEIHSFTSPNDFIRNLRNDTDIAFVDYYLGNGVTGSDIIKKIKERCWECKVVIVSQARNIKTTFLPVVDEAIDFVFKDMNALPQCCFLLENVVDSNYSPLHSSHNYLHSPFNIPLSPKKNPTIMSII